ncbi:hypothetical protein ACWCQN_25060 [Streptomyces sp. NPDC001984]
MHRDAEWHVIFAPGGWARVKNAAGDTTVYMRFTSAGEGTAQRLNVHTAVMDSVSPISAHVWRTVPFETVERLANDPRGYLTGKIGDRNPPREALLSDAESEPLDLEALERHFGTVEEVAEHDDPASGLIHRHGVGLIDVAGPGEEPPALKRPTEGITDEFLAALALRYRWLVDSGNSTPAVRLAEESSTPVATVRRWVWTARKKGLLPPGRPGRAG